MPFKISPARINGQPGFLFDAQEGLRCFYDESVYDWVIVDTDHTTPVVKVGDRELLLQPYLYNNSPVWGYYGSVFNSVTEGWIYRPSGLAEPYAEKDIDGETWIGDGWWKAGKPNPDYPEITCEPKGTFLNEGESQEPPVLTWWWPRWQWEKAGSSRAPWGTYVAKDGAEEICARRLLGSQRYRDARRRYWTLATDRESLSCTDGRIIRHVEEDDLWVLGVKCVGTWWQSAAGPDRESGMKLDAWKHDAEADEDVPDPDTDPVELTFYAFVATEGTDRMYMAEVALWR